MISENINKGKKISILGAGVSGCSLAMLAKKSGADVFVSDSQELSIKTTSFFYLNKIHFESGCNSERLLDADEIIVSSGISPESEILKEACKRNIKVTGELDFVSRFIECPVIAVTGSNGKTTTTSMIGYMLKAAGYDVGVCGNIGDPIANVVEKKHDYIVAELSSFQLYRAKKFKCNVAIVTNLAPDHINWHGSYNNYVSSKANIFKCLAEDGIAIYQERDTSAFEFGENITQYPLTWSENIDKNGIILDDSKKEAYIIKNGKKSNLFTFGDTSLIGSHNLENVAMTTAVLSVLGIKVDYEKLKTFTPPMHRCAFIGEVNGIGFVDDSKGTNVAASVTAMSCIPGKKIVILGGQGKGEEYSLLAQTVKKETQTAVLIGEEKNIIAESLDKVGFSQYIKVKTMKEAVNEAYKAAHEREIVLLSPACTSWDMYPSYAARGDDFTKHVKELIKREKTE